MHNINRTAAVIFNMIAIVAVAIIIIIILLACYYYGYYRFSLQSDQLHYSNIKSYIVPIFRIYLFAKTKSEYKKFYLKF